MGQGRIAQNIALFADLDREAKMNFIANANRRLAEYSNRFDDVNRNVSDWLGVRLVNDLFLYPNENAFIKSRPTVKGLAWDNSIWVNNDLPYAGKVRNHELAHVAFRHSGSNLPRIIKEIQAEGTAYGVGYKLGIPVDVLSATSVFPIFRDKEGYSAEQIGNMIEENRPIIQNMVDKFIQANNGKMKPVLNRPTRIARYD